MPAVNRRGVHMQNENMSIYNHEPEKGLPTIETTAGWRTHIRDMSIYTLVLNLHVCRCGQRPVGRADSARNTRQKDAGFGDNQDQARRGNGGRSCSGLE